MEIIDWLNSNSGIIIIFTIVVLIIIIGWYVYSRRRPLKTANESENISRSVSAEKPEIVAFLRPHSSSVQCLMLCIENIGTGPAYNIQFGTGTSATAPFITTSSNLGDVGLLKKNNFLQKGIGCFGAGQKIEQFLISLIGELPEELKQPLQISVTYTDSLNYTYENRYALDFGDFESLIQISSMEEKAISDLKPLLDAIQTGFSQIAENVECSSLPQTPKSTDSTTPSQEKEYPQPIQSEQDKSLPPELQEFVGLYNAGNDAKLREMYGPHSSICVSNEPERFHNLNVPPIFQTDSRGSFVAYAIDSENLYAAVPFSGCILQNGLYSSGAFGKVFECPGFDPEYKYHVKVIRPAFFNRDPAYEKWTLQEKGKLKLKEK